MLLNNTQTRGFAWQYRNRVRAWWVAQDGSPQKAILDKAMDDATASRCGIHDIDEFVGNTVRDTWNTNYATFYGTANIRPNALGFWRLTDGYASGDIESGLPSDSDGSAVAPWMGNFLVYALGHAVELGYTKATKLRDFAANWVIAFATSARPRLVGSYTAPSRKSNGTFFQSPTDLFAVWTATGTNSQLPASSAGGFPAGGAPNTFGVECFGYGNHAAHAIAACNGNAGQAAAWAVLQPYHANSLYLNHDPREAVIPRV
jgi:hypothetical protein